MMYGLINKALYSPNECTRGNKLVTEGHIQLHFIRQSFKHKNTTVLVLHNCIYLYKYVYTYM